jgi:hypothetical protein
MLDMECCVSPTPDPDVFHEPPENIGGIHLPSLKRLLKKGSNKKFHLKSM